MAHAPHTNPAVPCAHVLASLSGITPSVHPALLSPQDHPGSLASQRANYKLDTEGHTDPGLCTLAVLGKPEASVLGEWEMGSL